MKKYTAKLVCSDSDGTIYHYRGYEIQSFKSDMGFGTCWNIRPIGNAFPDDATNTLREAKSMIDEILWAEIIDSHRPNTGFLE
tara:strand:+ start:190 stop:438 length:249 start_codon:yes stop_codon:yes gene_type:complete